MNEREIYFDLDGNKLALSALAPDERRLVARLRRRARGNPKWKRFARWAYAAAEKFADDHHISRVAFVQWVPFKVLRDLIARLQIDQRHFPTIPLRRGWMFRHLMYKVLNQRRKALRILSEGVQIPECVILDILKGGGPNASPEDLLEFRERLDMLSLLMRVLEQTVQEVWQERRRPTVPEPAPEDEADDGDSPDVLYELHYVGGPADGRTIGAYRAYAQLIHADHAVYQAEMDGTQPVVEWEDDETRVVRLYFRGYTQAGEP